MKLSEFTISTTVQNNTSIFRKYYLVFCLFITATISGQSLGDYRTVATGNWTALASWQYFNGTSWVTPSGTSPQGYPGQFVGTNRVTIQAGHNITLNNITTQAFTLLTINGTLTFSGTGGNPIFNMNVATVVITSGLTPAATVNFTTKGTWQLPTNAILNVGLGGLSGSCTANQSILIGTTFFSYCNGGGSSVVTFDDLMASGGTLNAVATSNSPICETNTINLNGSITGLPGTGLTYNWTITNPLGAITTVAAQNTTVPNALAGTYTARLVCTSSYPGIPSYSNEETITVLVRALPTSVISGSQSICNGSTSGNISIALTGTQPWSLTYTNGTTPVTVSGITSSPYTFTVNPTVTSTYSVSALNDANCTSQASGRTGSAIITVKQRPTAVISGTQTICTGTTSNAISIALTGVQPWTLTYTDGTTPVTVSGITASPYTFTVSPSITKTYTLTALSDSNCTALSGDLSGSAVVTVNSLPTASAGGTQTICPTGAATVSGATATNGTLLWTHNGAGTLTNATTLTPTYSAAIADSGNTVTLTLTVSNNPCTPATALYTINVLPTALGGTLNGGTSICSGTTSGLLTLSGQLGAIIRWESAVSPFTTWSTIANTAATYTSGALTQTTQFRAVVQNGSCDAVYSSIATVSIEATTWNGSAWSNNAPNATVAAIFTGNYTAATNLQACSITVSNNAVVTIPTNLNVTIYGALTVDAGSSFIIHNNADLMQLTNAVNTGNVTVKRNSSALLRLDYTLWSSPVSNQNLLAFSPSTLTNRFYTYDTSSNLYVVTASPSTTNFVPMKGHLIRVPNTFSSITPTVYQGQFNGVPNNGVYNYTLDDFGSGFRFNAVGNPYPSPIDAVDFVTANSASITGTLYFWRKTNNAASPSYCTWTTAGFVSNNEAQVFDPNDVIQTGQGFFVEATGTNNQLVFNNAMRVDDHANQFFRNNQTTNTVERNRIWLNATNNTGSFSQAMVGYITNATNGFDARIDGKYINDGDIALTSLLGGEPMTIQGRALPFDVADVVPMRFVVTTAGNYTIAIDHVDGLFATGQNVYLRDNVMGTTHNLTEGAYSFASEAGTFDARFEVVFQSTLGTDEPTLQANQVVIYPLGTNAIVINTGNSIMSAVKIFDIRGRLLSESKDINASQTTMNVSLSNDVILVQITDDNGTTVTKKVIK